MEVGSREAVENVISGVGMGMQTSRKSCNLCRWKLDVVNFRLRYLPENEAFQDVRTGS